MKRIIAVYSICNTASVSIIECTDEFVTYLDAVGNWHRAKVYMDTSRPYFKYCGGFRIHLDECMAV